MRFQTGRLVRSHRYSTLDLSRHWWRRYRTRIRGRVAIAVGVMLVASGAISSFVEKHPTVKMLALSFLLLIGVSLMAEGFHHHIPKGYIYFAMGFSVFVEMINLRVRAKSEPVQLHQSYVK